MPSRPFDYVVADPPFSDKMTSWYLILDSSCSPERWTNGVDLANDSSSLIHIQISGDKPT